MAETRSAAELRDGVDATTGDALDLQLTNGPLLLSVGDDLEGAELVIFDGSGEEQRAIAASDQGGGFELEPGALPNPVELWWRMPGWAERLAGPCDPIALRDALAKGELPKAVELIGDPPAAESDDASGDSPPSGDDDDDDQELAPDGDNQYQAQLESEDDQ